MPSPGQPVKPGQIRLLTLRGAAGRDEPISCTLANVALETAAEDGYTALSYTWGPPSQPTRTVRVNGNDTAVGVYLHDALVQLRGVDDRRMWVDALCIRQDDPDDKTFQLPLMGRVYSLASAVEIWLGIDADDGEWVMAAIRDSDELTPALNFSDRGEAKRFYTAVAGILRRPWFTRVWIIQELVLARPGAVQLRIGACATSWLTFAAAVQHSGAHGVRTSGGAEPLEDIMGSAASTIGFSWLTMMRGRVEPSEQQRKQQDAGMGKGIPAPLAVLCIATRRNRASDPRDKIYGLLGMVDDDTREALAPDYRKDPTKVFCDASIFLLKRSPELLFFFPVMGCSRTPAAGEKVTTIHPPSWLLDFSFSESLYVEDGFLADGLDLSYKTRTFPTIRFAPYGEALGLCTPATLVDTISHHFTFPARPADLTESGVAKFASAVAAACELYYDTATKLAAPWTAEQPLEPVWETLLGSDRSQIEGFGDADLRHRMDIITCRSSYHRRPRVSAAELGIPPNVSTADLVLEHGSPLAGALYGALIRPDRNLSRKTFFVTDHGLCGVCVGEPRVGDTVAVLFRGSTVEVPFVLRRSLPSPAAKPEAVQEDGDKFGMVGVASLSGDWVRYCEAEGKLEPKEITVV